MSGLDADLIPKGLRFPCQGCGRMKRPTELHPYMHPPGGVRLMDKRCTECLSRLGRAEPKEGA